MYKYKRWILRKRKLSSFMIEIYSVALLFTGEASSLLFDLDHCYFFIFAFFRFLLYRFFFHSFFSLVDFYIVAVFDAQRSSVLFFRTFNCCPEFEKAELCAFERNNFNPFIVYTHTHIHRARILRITIPFNHPSQPNENWIT